MDGVEGLYRCATMRRCYAHDLLDGGRTTTMNLASDWSSTDGSGKERKRERASGLALNLRGDASMACQLLLALAMEAAARHAPREW